MYIFDTETNGLLKELTRVHVLVVREQSTRAVVGIYRHNDVENTIPEGLALLTRFQADGCLLKGHNSIEFDVPALLKVYPQWKVDKSRVLDTIVEARVIYPDLSSIDSGLVKRGKLPAQLQKRHSLEAWGHRLGCHKGEYKGDPELYLKLVTDGMDEEKARAETYKRRWESWNQSMEDYCVQDTDVTALLGQRLDSKEYSQECLSLEHQVAWILARQQRYGFQFDVAAAGKLYATLVAHKLRLEAELIKTMPPLYLRDGKEFIPKKDNKRLNYTAGAPVTKLKLTPFNPGSRDHIALVFMRKRGWVPTEYTNDGKPKVDETVLMGLDYPEAKPIHEYMMVEKRIGQVSEGKEGWLKRVQDDGRMHGRIVGNGAVTGRMTHMGPNIGQVPASYSPYGVECRSLYMVGPGKVLVGADAAALELRDLAGYMAHYDGGAYIRTVLEGKKADGTDIHSVNAKALGLDPKHCYFGSETGRDLAKTWFYAFIYGAGDEKLGQILSKRKGAEAVERGSESRASFLRNLPALGKLIKAIKDKVKKTKTLRGLDGRLLLIRSQHAAPNTLLQSAGAVQMKRALVILDAALQAKGLCNSDSADVDYEFVANVHDEWQLEVNSNLGDIIGKAAVDAIREAGVYYKFRCPLDGEFKVGRNWAETH